MGGASVGRAADEASRCWAGWRWTGWCCWCCSCPSDQERNRGLSDVALAWLVQKSNSPQTSISRRTFVTEQATLLPLTLMLRTLHRLHTMPKRPLATATSSSPAKRTRRSPSPAQNSTTVPQDAAGSGKWKDWPAPRTQMDDAKEWIREW